MKLENFNILVVRWKGTHKRMFREVAENLKADRQLEHRMRR